MKKLLVIVFILVLKFQSFSFHLVGGEMVYNDLGNGKYQIILKIYRDCAAGQNAAPFDGTGGNSAPCYITIYDGNKNYVGIYNIGSPSINRVPSAFNNSCILAPNNICIEEGVYTYTLNLPPKTGGYTLVYQKCCRNSIIENLVNPDSQGVTYFTKIPGPEDAAINSSPRYSKFPPIYICHNVALKFDHSAVDPDGDKLVYSICAPYAGLDNCCAALGQLTPQVGAGCISPPGACPQVAPPPPYTNVLFASPYSGSYPIDSNPSFSINSSTGELSGTPTLIGQYVVGICVQEYRNNILLNTHFRDFQFTVIGCTVNVVSSVADQKQQCQGKTIIFNNQSINNSSTPTYHWDFGVQNINSDTSSLVNPTYTYPDTGIYVVSLTTNPGKPCNDIFKRNVYVYPPLDINFDKQKAQCLRTNSFNFSVNGLYASQATFLWDFSLLATPATSTIKNPRGIHFIEAGLYKVKLQAVQFSCSDTFIDSVRIIGPPKAKINNLPGNLCDPAKIGFSNGSSSVLPLKYYWTFSDGETSTEFEPVKLFSPAGVYSVELTVETQGVCSDTSISRINNIVVYPKPKANFTLNKKETSIFEPEITYKTSNSYNPLMYYYTFGDGENSLEANGSHSYATYGNFVITQYITNDFNCEDTISEVVKILPEFRFWIPNGFTPDDNKLNDFFMPSITGAINYQFTVFNRWGQNIFSSSDSRIGWDGTFKGELCEQGIYTWKITFKNVVTDKSEIHLGHVSLLRNL